MTADPALGVLAKDALDVGVFTNQLEPMLAFWQQEVGLPFDHMLPVGGGVRQHRHDHAGSVFKLNHSRAELPEAAPAGYLRLLIARSGIEAPAELTDPDGNSVVLVPPGYLGIEQWAIEVATGSVNEFFAFYRDGLGLPIHEHPDVACAVSCGRSIVIGVPDQGLAAVGLAQSQSASAEMRRTGFRYTTIQVQRVDAVHAQVLANGGLNGREPTTLVQRRGYRLCATAAATGWSCHKGRRWSARSPPIPD